MTKLTTEEIRSKFISYFVANNHVHVPASPLIPHNDPSLMFVNSGMVQFKNVFTGHETRDYKRAVTSQKSIRAGGKHNDLDNVGYTARHHTFFEMLGNFSFGDYFKEEAIYYAWDLLTKEFGIAKDKLYVTVYHTDDEAAVYWKKIASLSDEKIIRIKTNDNFWSMGDLGPCGPCSEIFYDHGETIKGGLPGTKDADGDRFVEIWNLVFMQYEQIDKDTKTPLPKKSVDTGMGLERISSVLQGVHDNYDIDLFKEIIAYTSNFVKVKPEGEAKFSYRVIADHLRACAFLISDGVVPSNEGRGYVLRRIMRRSMRHAHLLESSDPLMYKLLPKLVELMGSSYPELKRAEDFISNILKQEEIRFKATLERGLKLLDEETKVLNTSNVLPGEVAFKLYDTYGFPLDLTEDILKNKQISVDHDGFNRNMQEQRDRARKSWLGSNESKTDKIWFDIKSNFGSTEFLGYALNETEGTVLALIKCHLSHNAGSEGATYTEENSTTNLQNDSVQQITDIGTKFMLISNQTPFYGESGGQMGDVGYIKSASSKIKVVNTLKYLGGIIAHVCMLEEGSIKVDEVVHFAINTKYRHNLKVHHSATHILHAVLREVLGKHVTQKGSLVAYDRLRFDISHGSSISKEEITIIEDKVNKIITDNSKVETTLMLTDDAVKAGAMALFGEKYDTEVRVVSMGEDKIMKEAYSIELCGGTHVNRTGDIGAFKIISESAVAAGIRRIEAVCGEFVLKLMRQNDVIIESLANMLKVSKNELIDKADSLINRQKELEKEVVKLQISSINMSKNRSQENALDIDGVKFIYKYLTNIDTKILRMAAEELTNKVDSLVILYISNQSGKLSITVALSKNISTKFHAGNLAKEISLFLGGTGGGGQSTLAQAGGSDTSKLESVEKKFISLLK